MAPSGQGGGCACRSWQVSQPTCPGCGCRRKPRAGPTVCSGQTSPRGLGHSHLTGLPEDSSPPAPSVGRRAPGSAGSQWQPAPSHASPWGPAGNRGDRKGRYGGPWPGPGGSCWSGAGAGSPGERDHCQHPPPSVLGTHSLAESWSPRAQSQPSMGLTTCCLVSSLSRPDLHKPLAQHPGTWWGPGQQEGGSRHVALTWPPWEGGQGFHFQGIKRCNNWTPRAPPNQPANGMLAGGQKEPEAALQKAGAISKVCRGFEAPGATAPSLLMHLKTTTSSLCASYSSRATVDPWKAGMRSSSSLAISTPGPCHPLAKQAFKHHPRCSCEPHHCVPSRLWGRGQRGFQRLTHCPHQVGSQGLAGWFCGMCALQPSGIQEATAQRPSTCPSAHTSSPLQCPD